MGPIVPWVPPGPCWPSKKSDGPEPSGSGTSDNERSGVGIRLLAGTTLRLRLVSNFHGGLCASLGNRSSGRRGCAVLVRLEHSGGDPAPRRHFEAVGVGPLADRGGLPTGSTRSR